jgi:hypothetical protein
MRVFGLFALVIISVALIFFGHSSSRQKLDDRKKYGSDVLIKKISEYNVKEHDLEGYVGQAGVTRTPLRDQDAIKGIPSRKTPAATRDNNTLRYPAPQKPIQPASQPPKPAAPSNTNDYYPPPPAVEDPEAQQYNNYSGPRSSLEESSDGFKLPFPPSPNPHIDYLRGGQKISYQSDIVYTYDVNGKPAPMPDGEYDVRLPNGKYIRMYVQDGKNMLQPDE